MKTRASHQWETDWLYPSKHLPTQETTRREGQWPPGALPWELKVLLLNVLLTGCIHAANDGAETGALHHLVSSAGIARTAGREGGRECSSCWSPHLGSLGGQETTENVTNRQRQMQLGSGKHHTEISGKMSMNKGKRKKKASFLFLCYGLVVLFSIQTLYFTSSLLLMTNLYVDVTNSIFWMIYFYTIYFNFIYWCKTRILEFVCSWSWYRLKYAFHCP